MTDVPACKKKKKICPLQSGTHQRRGKEAHQSLSPITESGRPKSRSFLMYPCKQIAVQQVLHFFFVRMISKEDDDES